MSDPRYEYTTCHTCGKSTQFIDAGPCRCPSDVPHHTICGFCMWLSIDFGRCDSIKAFRADVAKKFPPIPAPTNTTGSDAQVALAAASEAPSRGHGSEERGTASSGQLCQGDIADPAARPENSVEACYRMALTNPLAASNPFLATTIAMADWIERGRK